MNTAIRSTSQHVYHHEVVPTLGDRQEVVFNLLRDSQRENWTNSEIAAALEWPINTVTPRVFELRKVGLVSEDVKRQCRVTGRTAIAWRIIKSTLF
jgi:Mn-dependent DtxR family transcriptional regulator